MLSERNALCQQYYLGAAGALVESQLGGIVVKKARPCGECVTWPSGGTAALVAACNEWPYPSWAGTARRSRPCAVLSTTAAAASWRHARKRERLLAMPYAAKIAISKRRKIEMRFSSYLSALQSLTIMAARRLARVSNAPARSAVAEHGRNVRRASRAINRSWRSGGRMSNCREKKPRRGVAAPRVPAAISPELIDASARLLVIAA